MLAAHVAKLLEQLWLILGKVKGLHWPRGRVGHHRHPHSGQLVAAAADPLYLTDSVQDGVHLGLKALLTHKHVLVSGSIKPQNDFQITCWQKEMQVENKMRSSTCEPREATRSDSLLLPGSKSVCYLNKYLLFVGVSYLHTIVYTWYLLRLLFKTERTSEHKCPNPGNPTCYV